MGRLLVLTGPPGAGKSTVAELVAARFDRSALVRGDDFFEFLRAGRIDPWLPDSHVQNTAVTEAAALATGRLVADLDVVYDGVIGPWFLDTFREFTGLDRLDYAVLLPPLEVCLQRVRDRVGHGFDDAQAAEHMWHQFDDADIDGRFRIADTADDPAAVADAVLDRSRSVGLGYPS